MNYRQEDERREKVVAKFLDEHFYVGEFERCTDKERQVKGIDTIFTADNGQIVKCDEKASVRYTNLKTFCQEIARLNRGGKWQEGWFTASGLETNAYLYVFVDDVDWTIDNIKKIEALLVSKKALKNYLLKQGFDDTKLLECDAMIRSTGIYPSAPKDCRWSFSDRLVEQPVNLLVSRDLLRTLAYKTYNYNI